MNVVPEVGGGKEVNGIMKARDRKLVGQKLEVVAGYESYSAVYLEWRLVAFV